MTNVLRVLAVWCTACFLAGCGEDPQSMDTREFHGAFNMIVAEVENLNVQVNFETYRRQQNPVEDQLGSAIHAFKTNEQIKGTPLEPEAQKLAEQEQELLKIWRSGATVEQIRTAAKEMQAQVDHMKTLMQ